MKFLESATNRLLLIILMFALFMAFKWQDIALPYFWDEMAGYMSGVLYMQDYGISILPTAVPPDLSYGHPLLMHATMACIAEVFGNTPTVMHLTTLGFMSLLNCWRSTVSVKSCLPCRAHQCAHMAPLR